MSTRREFLQGGLAALTLGMMRRNGLAMMPPLPQAGICPVNAFNPVLQTGPFAPVRIQPPSVMVEGFPFAEGFTGDGYANDAMPFHHAENIYSSLPQPSEEVDVAIVGGGISGMATGYMLRHHRPVVFELHDRFGGNAQGETWGGARYSLGSAYFITPDPGSFLQNFYKKLDLNRVKRVSPGGNDPMEFGGEVLPNFWHGEGIPAADVDAFAQYTEIVRYYAEEAYPEIPLPHHNSQWIIDLDTITLKQDIEQRMTVAPPESLIAGIQSYCYSSFGAGWEEISAAGGWNFLAAEEYGRWVLPGGNGYMVQALWQEILKVQRGQQAASAHCLLRGGARVVDVRLAPHDRVQVTWRDADGGFRALLAKRVVMACPKHVAKHILHDLDVIDPEKHIAMSQVEYAAYAVANVLLEAPMASEFYDLFLLGKEGTFPLTAADNEFRSRYVDAINANFPRRSPSHRNVLTLYWPLPFPSARVRLLGDNLGWNWFTRRVTQHLPQLLDLLNLPHSAVKQIRLTRWGHAMPISRPEFIASGNAALSMRPIDNRIHFVNQDNWALPAVENSLLDARRVATAIHQAL